MKRKRISNLIILPLLSFILLLSFFIAPRSIQAQDDVYGVNDMDLHLDQNLQPREAIVGIINLVLSFLGLIAVIIIIYGGFVWMTSGGEADKVNKAKKILKNGLIGLIIVLLSWGIVTWLLAQFPGIFGGGNGFDDDCSPGTNRQCYVCPVEGVACYGFETCLTGGFWGECVHSCDCDSGNGNGGQTGDSCDANPLVPTCDPDDTRCDEDYYYCSTNTCTCQPKGSYGDPCDADTSTLTCDEPQDNLCGPYLTCDQEDCICLGPPVITSVSPMGGFCDNNVNTPCLSDDDCPETCNTDTPNGATDNFITILGHNFGNDEGEVLFNNSIAGNSPSSLNANCIDTWSNNQIIIAVPGEGIDGPITVNTADGRSDSTDDDLGPAINDFVSNTIIRPGLCLIEPDRGVLNDEITYQGINLFQTAEAYFGNYIDNIKALEASLDSPNEYSGTAKVPNINRGRTSTFALGTIAGVSLYSNYLDFYKEREPDPGPYINSFYPFEEPVAPGQYITIYGGGFGNSRGNSKVYFGSVENEANYSFPEVCLHSVWSNNRVIVKVPENISVASDDGHYLIEMNIGGEIINTSLLNPDKIEINPSLSPAPSLCKISPVRGQAGTLVTLWGEYFGDEHSSVTAIFHFNEPVDGVVKEELGADYFETEVPVNAISGPVKVQRGALTGNSLNFEIGPCETDADCDSQICCPVGTYKANRCEDDINDCSIDIANSVFEWSFSTELVDKDFCNEITNLNECLSESECCFDGKENECVSVTNRLVFGEEEENAGYCKRWDCVDKDTTKSCDSENPVIEGDYINLNACYSNCDPEPPTPGISCFNHSSYTCNISACTGSGETFSCLLVNGTFASFPDCGACCCSMQNDKCSDINEILHCQPNQYPCTGDERGLCCGCTNDQQCGFIEDTGCGSDACCRSRPKVVKDDLIPPVDAENICRNAIIKIPFDQRMNINTLTFNILLLEEREPDDFCPTGTLITKNTERDNKNFFARLFDNIKNSFNYIFKGSSKTALALPDSDKLYCLVPGSVRVEQEAQRSVAYYQPSRLLRDETNYYIVVKGDEELNSETGVLSAWGIGMNGEGYDNDEGEDIEFNSVSFSNSFISKFTTMDDQEINSGVCEIDHVRISPSSYLFNTTENDLNEEDSDSDHETFDTARDRDKVFMANAYTIDNQIIGPTDGYMWDWQWTIGNENILEFLGTHPPLLDNQEFISVRSHVTEANTYLEAKVDMSSYPDNFTYIGDGKYAQADITVFICRNPWPRILPHYNNWSPWYDEEYNYQIYYCRDDGSSIFADDLPALIYPPVIPGTQDSFFVCSTTNLPCSPGETRCGPNNEGYCILSVLTESYFFREARPSAGNIVSAVPLEEGRKIRLILNAKADLIHHENPQLRGHFRIYYAKDGQSFSYVEVSTDNCNINDSNNYVCNYTVDNLENDQLYVFRASSVSRTNIETFFSNEIKETPKDTLAPGKPSACGEDYITETIINEDGEEEEVPVKVLFSCENLDDDVVRLRLYHGISAGNYGQYFEGEIDQEIFEFNIDYFNQGTHHFAISAYDESGNESERSDNFEVNF